MTALGSTPLVVLPRDSADLRCLAELLNAHRRWETETGLTANLKALREWLWFNWQAPRRPQPLVRSKYPAAYPWSAAARQALARDPKCRLVLEHREPINLVIRHLLDHPTADVEELRQVLATRLVCCVVTAEEDAAITKAGFGVSLVPGAEHDPWARYRLAGIDPDRFAPLQPN